MGFRQPGPSLGPRRGNDWDSEDQVRAGAVGVGDVGGWDGVLGCALPVAKSGIAPNRKTGEDVTSEHAGSALSRCRLFLV